MLKYLTSVKKFWINELKFHKIVYFLLTIILVGAFFIRAYRTGDLLRFYFDQGRDALVIWKLWHEGKPFLIGPVTGLAGIFLGPFYYYLIAPFYLIGGGSPVYPAVFLALLTTIAIGVTYYLGWQIQSRVTGLIAAAIAGFSYYMVLAGRWLANPTPILLTSVLLLLSMWKLVEGKVKNTKFLWFSLALLIGVSLHFEAASAIFYIPMIIIFWMYLYLTNKKVLPNKVIFVISILLFGLTLLPQIAFNYKHENILFNNFQKVLVEEKSFQSPFTSYNLTKKRDFFWGVFSSKIFPGIVKYANIYYLAGLLGVVFALRKIPKTISPLIIFIGVPMIGYFFFQGNYGNIYDYYMTGYYLPMILLFSIGLGFLWKNFLGKILVLVFFLYFCNLSGTLDRNLIYAGVDGPTHITLGNQLQSVNWVFEDANQLCDPEEILRLPTVAQDEECSRQFNVDVYVPPVIPHAYDYLFLWQATKRCGDNLCGMIKEPQKKTVYVLYEVDPPHPERLEVWLSRYEENSVIEEEVKFGGITVQIRKRI